MDRFNRANVAFVSVTQNFSTADAMGGRLGDFLPESLEQQQTVQGLLAASAARGESPRRL